MSGLRRLGRRLHVAWSLWRTGGTEAIADRAREWLRIRLGVDELEHRVERTAPAASTWAFTSWIEQAAVDPSPLISVILPTHNRAALLPRAVASVRAQRYAAWEIVLVDDASADDTPAVVERLQAELGPDHLQSVRVPPGGVCAARNRALASARGSLIAYLDDDNAMHPLLAQGGGVGLRAEAGRGRGVRRHRRRRPAPAEPARFRHAAVVSPVRSSTAPCSRRPISPTSGRSPIAAGLPEARFDEALREMGDWDLLIRLTRQKAPLVLPAIACFYHTDSPSRLSGGPTADADARRVRTKAQAP